MNPNLFSAEVLAPVAIAMWCIAWLTMTFVEVAIARKLDEDRPLLTQLRVALFHLAKNFFVWWYSAYNIKRTMRPLWARELAVARRILMARKYGRRDYNKHSDAQERVRQLEKKLGIESTS